MKNIVPKRRIRNFLLIIILSTLLFDIVGFVNLFFQGYNFGFMILFFVWILTALAYVVILIICLIKSIKWTIKSKHYWPLPLVCLSCFFIGAIWRPFSRYADPMFLGQNTL